MTLRPFSRPRLWLGLWIAGWVACVVLSLLPSLPLPDVPDSDKWGHFLAYFTLSAWAVGLFASRRAHLLAALALVGLGVAMEIAQASLTTMRVGDLRDALANTLGVALGLALTFTPSARFLHHLDRLLPKK